jgi:hypothetical protein
MAGMRGEDRFKDMARRQPQLALYKKAPALKPLRRNGAATIASSMMCSFAPSGLLR